MKQCVLCHHFGMDLIEEIERLRVAQGLSPTEMAEKFGVRYQNYNNWRARNSLPKSHINRARQILAEAGLTDDKTREATEIMGKLSPRAKETALQQIRAIYDLDQEFLGDPSKPDPSPPHSTH